MASDDCAAWAAAGRTARRAERRVRTVVHLFAGARRDDDIHSFVEAMADDLNTPRALAVLFALARDINRP